MPRRGSCRRSLGIVLVVAALLAACGGSSDDQSEPAPASGDAVGRLDLTLVDATRPTPADPPRNLPERPDRTLPVSLLYPTQGDDPADGTYPLIVFAHGHSREGPEYVELLSSWVRAGYVVAAPSFPLSSGSKATTGVSYADVLNQPADLSFVIQELTTGDSAPLTGHIDAQAVGVVGHSLGAITALGRRNNTCCIDPAVRGVVAVAGAELPFPGARVEGSAAPLLLIHGGTDPTVPVAGSESAFAASAPPASFLRLTEGGHDEVFDGGGALAELTGTAILSFFDQTLRGEEEGWAAFPGEVERSGLGTLEQRPS